MTQKCRTHPPEPETGAALYSQAAEISDGSVDAVSAVINRMESLHDADLDAVAIDFWRGLALQRELAAVADSAAIAPASGIDEEHHRQTGEVVLEAARANTLGQPRSHART